MIETTMIIPESPKDAAKKDFNILDRCRIIYLPMIPDHRGNLTFLESNKHIPFEIKRAYYLYDVPRGKVRAGDAHKTDEQFVVAVSGSFDITLDNGFEKKRIHLNRPHYGLYIDSLIWREIGNFSLNSVCFIFSSTYYNEADYYRDYHEFTNALKAKSVSEEIGHSIKG